MDLIQLLTRALGWTVAKVKEVRCSREALAAG